MLQAEEPPHPSCITLVASLLLGLIALMTQASDNSRPLLPKDLHCVAPIFPILSGPLPSTLRAWASGPFPWLHRWRRPGDQPTERGDKLVQEGQITQLQPEDQRETAKDR